MVCIWFYNIFLILMVMANSLWNITYGDTWRCFGKANSITQMQQECIWGIMC